MEEGGERGVGEHGAFGLEVADLEIKAFDVAVQLMGVSGEMTGTWRSGIRTSNAAFSLNTTFSSCSAWALS